MAVVHDLLRHVRCWMPYGSCPAGAKRRAKSPKAQEAFWAQAAVLCLLSLVYPVLIVVAPDRLGLIDEKGRHRRPCRHGRNGQSHLRARVRDRRPAADYG